MSFRSPAVSRGILEGMERSLRTQEQALVRLELPAEEDSLIGRALAQALTGVRLALNRSAYRVNLPAADDRPQAPSAVSAVEQSPPSRSGR